MLRARGILPGSFADNGDLPESTDFPARSNSREVSRRPRYFRIDSRPRVPVAAQAAPAFRPRRRFTFDGWVTWQTRSGFRSDHLRTARQRARRFAAQRFPAAPPPAAKSRLAGGG